MMVVKQKHFSFPVHFLDTIQLYPAPHRNFIETAEVEDGLHSYVCATGHGRQDAKVTQRSPGPETLPCPCRHVIQQTGDFSIFLTYLKCGKLWETMSSWFFSVLQLYVYTY